MPAADPFTVCFWIYFVADRAAASIFFLDSNIAGTDGVALSSPISGAALRLEITTFVGGVPTENTGSLLSTATWYHMALTRNGNSFKAYLNGNLDVSVTTSLSFTCEVIQWSTSTSGFWYNGRIQAAKFWTAELSQSDIRQEMWSQTPQRTNNLWGWWPMLSVTDLVDYSANGRDLTAGNSPTSESGPPVAWRQGRKKVARSVYFRPPWVQSGQVNVGRRYGVVSY